MFEKKPLTLNLERLPDDGKPKPLRIHFDITLAAGDPAQQRIWPALGHFLAEFLLPEEAHELLDQWAKKMEGKDAKS